MTVVVVGAVAVEVAVATTADMMGEKGERKKRVIEKITKRLTEQNSKRQWRLGDAAYISGGESGAEGVKKAARGGER